MATSKTLTSNQLTHLFGVSLMTISTWRKGTPTMNPLPTTPVKGDPRAVAFSVADVKKWAKANDRTYDVKGLELMTNQPKPDVALLKAAKAGKFMADKKAAATTSGRISAKTPATSNTPKAGK